MITAGAVSPEIRGSDESLLDAAQLAPSAVLLLTATVVGLTLIDARRRNELLFLANLGVSRMWIASLAAIPVILFEFVIGVL